MSTPSSPPSSILILGSGVFGLSTALSLCTRPSFSSTKITLLDRLPFPAPDSSSIDSSRIIRADYPSAAYASLMTSAFPFWRDTALGAENRYTQSGLCLVSEDSPSNASDSSAHNWVTSTLATMTSTLNLRVGSRASGADITAFSTPAGGREAMGSTGGFLGSHGYVNWTSGWAHAEKAMRWTREQVERTGRVEFVTGTAKRLLYESEEGGDGKGGTRVVGVELEDGGKEMRADVVVVATGAWTGALVDLRGVASATGQVLAYVALTEEEQRRLEGNAVIMCETDGFFIIPPTERVLKVARHGYGYANLVDVPHPERGGGGGGGGGEEGERIRVSLPRTKVDDPLLDVAKEGLDGCREFLKKCIPDLGEREWEHTRICWYMDTPNGDWLIDWHPKHKGLFVATGGSGHGFKFLPVIGERIVDLLEGNQRDELGTELKSLWKWPEERSKEDHIWTSDWRGGRKGMHLDEELAKK